MASAPTKGGGGAGPLLRALLGCCVWPGTWASGAHWAAHDAASTWARPARRRDLRLMALAQPWLWGSPTGPCSGDGSAELCCWTLAGGSGHSPSLGTDALGKGLRGSQGGTQGGPSESQPVKACDPEPHFHENHLQSGIRLLSETVLVSSPQTAASSPHFSGLCSNVAQAAPQFIPEPHPLNTPGHVMLLLII